MTRREFRAAYRDIDPEVVDLLWEVYLRATFDQRANLVDALDRLRGAAERERFDHRHPMSDPAGTMTR